MKNDLDALMQAENLDALLVVGAAYHNPAMVYLTGGGHISQAELLKPRGRPATLYCRPMEREEAARTGLDTVQVDLSTFAADLAAAGGDAAKGEGRRYARMLKDAGLEQGRVAVFGQSEVGSAFAIFSALQEELPGLRLIGQTSNSIFLAAMATKDASEVERIREMGRITTEVIAETADFISSHRVHNETLMRPDGEPLTIGDVHRRINLWLAERGAENPNATIFAQGRDAGIPHSTGTNSEALRLGKTIVYDIFPAEPGGGYFYDMTRTWCLGYAPDDAQKLYDDVRAVYDQLYAELRLGTPARNYQLRCCELFEQRGHPTINSTPGTQSGYVHSLGHGVGLNIHERPTMRASADESEILQAGNIITLEPGLYYPERGMGVRLEDTMWVRPDGVFEILADYPLDLVLPVRGGN